MLLSTAPHCGIQKAESSSSSASSRRSRLGFSRKKPPIERQLRETMKRQAIKPRTIDSSYGPRANSPPNGTHSSSSRMTAFSKTKPTVVDNMKTIKLAFIAISSVLLILLVLTNQVESLNCYTCSSADDPGCDESFSGRANFTGDAIDCEKQLNGRQAKVCRKIIQHIEHKKVVIRSCGTIDEHEERKPMCYKRSGTFALMMESCICYEDLCNHSASLVPNSSVLLLLAGLSSLILLKKLSNYPSLG